jgi:membrane associated rhomboid family serine protease
MFTSIWDDIKREYEYGNMITRIIIVNLAVFIFWNVAKFAMFLAYRGVPPPAFYEFLQCFEVSSGWWHNVTHPWVLITYMFTHIDFWHVLWNMLLFYSFGRILGDLIGDRHILPLYLFGGLMGGIAFFLSYIYLGRFEAFALGASASVTATVVAAGIIAPNYLMRLILLGDVKLKYIVLAFLVIDMAAIANDSNTGGHFAHLGGAFMGYLYIRRLQEGNDLSEPVNNILDGIINIWKRIRGEHRPKPTVAYRNREKVSTNAAERNQNRPSQNRSGGGVDQAQIDVILDKIKQSGYDSLSQEEKEILFKASRD